MERDKCTRLHFPCSAIVDDFRKDTKKTRITKFKLNSKRVFLKPSRVCFQGCVLPFSHFPFFLLPVSAPSRLPYGSSFRFDSGRRIRKRNINKTYCHKDTLYRKPKLAPRTSADEKGVDGRKRRRKKPFLLMFLESRKRFLLLESG